jgi:tetratricopeptide (TPR) repeat protein
LTFSATTYLPALRWEYALKRAFTLFMEYLLPIHAAAVAVAASLSFDRGPARPGAPARPFHNIVSSALVAFLVLTAVYTALAEGVAPGARKRLSDMVYVSRVADEYKKRAAAAMKTGDYGAAQDAISRYLAVDPGNKEMVGQQLEASSRAARQVTAALERIPADTLTEMDKEDAQALIEKARFYRAQGDWFSAHYYAQAAFVRDPRRADALALASEASNRIAGLTREEKDQKTKELFLSKKNALGKLESGDVLGAYYAFVGLAEAEPKDPDIANYLAKARDRVRAAAFFVDEARKVESLPGTQDILFLNRLDAESTEAVSIGKIVELPGGDAFFFDIEAVRYDATGKVAWHFTAPLGRREGDSILLHAADRKDPAIQYLPLYVQGTRPETERFLLRLVPSMEEVRALSSTRAALAGMSIGEMWQLRERLGAYGVARQAIGIEMTMRLVMPFAFLVLSVLCTAMGWSMRVRGGGRIPAIGVILMPLLPVVLALLSLLYLHAHRILIGFTVIGFGLTVAFIAMAAIQVVLLAFSLVVLAGQSSS